MITGKMQEVFEIVYGYLNDESKYKPLVTKKAPLQSTTFPVVEVRGLELPLDSTTRKEEENNRLTATINIYAIEKVIDGKKVSSLQVAEELAFLVDKVMNELNFTMTANEEVENADKNVYRRFMRYTAGVSKVTNKITRRN